MGNGAHPRAKTPEVGDGADPRGGWVGGCAPPLPPVHRHGEGAWVMGVCVYGEVVMGRGEFPLEVIQKSFPLVKLQDAARATTETRPRLAGASPRRGRAGDGDGTGLGLEPLPTVSGNWDGAGTENRDRASPRGCRSRDGAGTENRGSGYRHGAGTSPGGSGHRDGAGTSPRRDPRRGGFATSPRA